MNHFEDRLNTELEQMTRAEYIAMGSPAIATLFAHLDPERQSELRVRLRPYEVRRGAATLAAFSTWPEAYEMKKEEELREPEEEEVYIVVREP